MGRVLGTTALAVLVGLLGPARAMAQLNQTTYADVAQLTRSHTGTAGTSTFVTFTGPLTGQLTGSFTITLFYKGAPAVNATSTITGGMFQANITQNGAAGTLSGTVNTGSTVQWTTPDPGVAQLALTTQMGSGAYRGFKGTITFKAAWRSTASPPSLTGPLVITLVQMTYADVAQLTHTRSGTSGRVRIVGFAGTLNGQLPGTLALTCFYSGAAANGAVSTILGGTFTASIVQNGKVVGTLMGSVASGGTIQWTSTTPAPSGAVQMNLIIQGGTGAYQGAGGAITFKGIWTEAKSPGTLAGPMIFSF
jgi:hypothetical protein